MIEVGDIVSWHLPLAGYYRDIARPQGEVVFIEGSWAILHRRNPDPGICPLLPIRLSELRLEQASNRRIA